MDSIEKSQEQIIYERVCIDRCLGDFRGYPLGSVGNVVHWLRALGFRDYDRVQVGENTVYLWGEILATYKIDEELGMPVFTFNNKEWLQHTQDTYIAGIGKFPNPYEQYLRQ